MPNPLSELLNAAYVDLELKATSKPEAIHDVATLLDGCPGVAHFAGFCDELIAREELSSTVVGHGVAFPHTRTDCVREILLAIGRSQTGIQFGDERVHLIFVIGTPRSKIKEYLIVVGTLARLLKNETLRQRLLAAPTREEFLACLGA